ncbi:winged helix-turn-helix domain-containing protein [Vibrio sp. WXL210]|uniref:winged helix-turn-helix domain-containing protein n=1 Tax=Vibrio sp. WXL210 TaxID=3450709 RepID=UPI003EC56767
MESLSLPQAQKLALLAQGLPSSSLKGTSYQKTVQVMDNLGYVQIDTISVVQRAHHHTLWSRNPAYQLTHLDRMVQERRVFEYWSHAASYLTMRDFRFSLPRKHAIQSDKQGHWFKKDHKLMSQLLSRIRADGPLMAKDFESRVIKKTGWESRPTKQALEMLYMQGDLMISERRNFHKVYDLTERVLPSDIDNSVPSAQEHARFLIINTLKTQGLARLAEMVYLLKGVKSDVQVALNEMIESHEVMPVSVNHEVYYLLPDSLQFLERRLARKAVKILSPFDNFIIQRNRLRDLFCFDYLLECYVPANKRQYGYFCLPVLWDGRLVARIDCKAHRKQARLEVSHLFIEPSLINPDDFEQALAKALEEFARFNHCDHYAISKRTHLK